MSSDVVKQGAHRPAVTVSATIILKYDVVRLRMVRVKIFVHVGAMREGWTLLLPPQKDFEWVH